MAVSPSEYIPLDNGLYELQNCKVLGKLPGHEEYFDFGDCDSARLEVSVTKISRKARNQKTRVTSIEAVTDVTSTLTLRAMQFSKELRSIALLGDAAAHTQAAGAFVFNIKSAKAGGYYNVGKLDISAVAVTDALYDDETDAFTAGDALAAGSFKVVDAAAGMVQLVGGFTDGDAIQITGTAAAITAADDRTRIEFATKTQIELELILRGVSDIGAPFQMVFPKWQASPSGIDFIGADDFSGQDLAGSVIKVGNSIGTWTKMSTN
jgi:hypothetical protein